MARVAMIVWNDCRNDARVLKEAETLQKAGHAVTIFALHTPGVTLENETLPSGVQVKRISRRPPWSAARSSGAGRPPHGGKRTFAAQSLHLLSRWWTHCALLVRMVASRPDVVHAHDVNTLPTGWLAATCARAALVYDAHEISTDREGYRSFRTAVGWTEKRLMPRAAATITTTDARAKFFARAYRIPRPLVLQNRPRLVAVARTDRIRRELRLAEPWPIVLYQGGLQQGRGLARLVEAAGQIDRAYFVFIGGGPLAGLLEKQAEAAGLAGRVRFIPTVSLADLPSYTASADIGVQPLENTCLNHLTTDSNKLFEYMMGGLPVVASDLPEIRRIMNEHGFGIAVPPGDTKALAQAIQRLLDDEEMRLQLAAKARKAALRINWEEQEQRLVALYRKLAGEPIVRLDRRLEDALDT